MGSAAAGTQRTGFVSHALCRDHLAGPAHPERPGRLDSVARRIEESGLCRALAREEAGPASVADVARVHASEYVDRVRQACARGPAQLDSDTAVSEASFDAALHAAGGLLHACERVVSGQWSNAFVAVRPPGHHAERDHAMGFCLFNSVAIAAASLRARHGLERVAILDWDVHHGNGTQHAFESDPSVFYASLHQWPLYPGTGAANEQGLGPGRGFTLNCPQPAGSRDRDWLSALEGEVLPAFERFAPEFVLLSAGFDAHRLDPLAGCDLESDAYRAMTRALLDFARGACRGRVVSVLEGGYHLQALADSVEVHVSELVEGAV